MPRPNVHTPNLMSSVSLGVCPCAACVPKFCLLRFGPEFIVMPMLLIGSRQRELIDQLTANAPRLLTQLPFPLFSQLLFLTVCVRTV